MKPRQTALAEWDAADAAPLLDGREFEEIRQLAYKAFGLDLRDGKRELVSARLRKVLREKNIRSYRDYCRRVLEDRTGEALAGLADALTTNHTSFLREPEHFRFLRETLLPGLARRARISVWSAACSTGEEAWTLAFVLADALPSRNFRIEASDISNRVLARAGEACYSADRVAVLPPSHHKYVQRGQGDRRDWYTVAPDLRTRVAFRRLNLIEPYSWPEPFPVIFCRNVMIYFDKPTQERVVSNLSASLEPGGHLFVGHSESLAGVRHGLEYVRPAVYRKPGGRGTR